MNDVRFALRQHFKHSGFFAAAVLMLALGIGAATSLFSAVYGVLIDPYPYAKPGEIWTPGLRSATANQRMRPYPPKEYLEMAKLSAFSDVIATGPGNVLLTGEFAPETIRGVRLSGNAFNFLGVPPLIGRTIQPSDIRATGEPEVVTVLSFRRWQRLFGGDPNAVGKILRLDDQPYTIIGVMPPRFGWWTDDGVWLPMGTDSRDQQGVFPIVRLASGTSSSVAEQRLHVLHREFAKANPTGYPRDEFHDVDELSRYHRREWRNAAEPATAFRSGGVAPADRLRECCELAACAGDVANAGNGDPTRCRCRTGQARTAVVDGKRSRFADRRSARTDVRCLDDQAGRSAHAELQRP